MPNMCRNAACIMVEVSDFLCSIYMCMHPPYTPISYLAKMSYIPNVKVIFVSGTYLAIICEVHDEVGCVRYIYAKIFI